MSSIKNTVPTQKQMDYIRDIEEYLGITFIGKTKREAQQYLAKYAPIYEDQIDAELEANYDTANAMDRI